jgi:hypothetical protein
LTVGLINVSNCRKYKVEFDRTTLIYFKEILSNYDKMVMLGINSVNDVRKKFNKDATEGGDGVFVTTNSQLLTRPKVDPLDESGTPEEEVNKQPEINNPENNDNENGNT